MDETYMVSMWWGEDMDPNRNSVLCGPRHDGWQPFATALTLWAVRSVIRMLRDRGFDDQTSIYVERTPE